MEQNTTQKTASLEELLAQQKQITQLIEQQRQANRHSDVQKAVALIEAHEITPKELAAALKWTSRDIRGIALKAKAKPLYQITIKVDGKDKLVAWSGKGAKPKAIREWLAADKTRQLDGLRIK